MKIRRLVTGVGITLGVSLLGMFLVGIVAAVADQARIVYATPEMYSPFLRTYTLTPVLDRFRSTKHSYSGGDGSGSGAGYGFTTHEREFHHFFVMKSSERPALMAALVESVSSELSNTGAQIVTETGSADEGVQFRYIAGQSSGTVTIEPPSRPANARVPFLCPDEMPISVNIRIEEKWTKPGA
ncbi:MAG: hypothetical protein WCA49_22400 [Candidatus Sulfotelmatobacter sp.]